MSLSLPSGLVVSCQAREDNPLHGPAFMAAMARAAEQAGAVALRANGAADIRAIRKVTDLPVIGIDKRFAPGREVYITPTLASAREVLEAGARIVALDCTARPRDGDPWQQIAAFVQQQGGEVFADISTEEEGLAAAAAGVDYVATTLAGHTEGTRGRSLPDIALVEALTQAGVAPVVAEGGYATPADAVRALKAGARAVVVGTAITNPREITRAFVAALG